MRGGSKRRGPISIWSITAGGAEQDTTRSGCWREDLDRQGCWGADLDHTIRGLEGEAAHYQGLSDRDLGRQPLGSLALLTVHHGALVKMV